MSPFHDKGFRPLPHFLGSLLALVILAPISAAQAIIANEEPPRSVMEQAVDLVEISEVESYLRIQREVRQELDRDRGYRKLDAEARARLVNAQDSLFQLLSGVQYFDELSPNRKIQVRKAQQEVRAALLDVRGQREVCWRERPLGSRIAETICATQAQLDEIRQGGRDFAERLRTCSGDRCGRLE